jgi:hypothetical protein
VWTSSWTWSGFLVLFLSLLLTYWILVMLLSLLSNLAERWPRDPRPGWIRDRIRLGVWAVLLAGGGGLVFLTFVFADWLQAEEMGWETGWVAWLIDSGFVAVMLALGLWAWRRAEGRRARRRAAAFSRAEASLAPWQREVARWLLRIRIGRTAGRRLAPAAVRRRVNRPVIGTAASSEHPKAERPATTVRWLLILAEIGYVAALIASVNITNRMTDRDLAGALGFITLVGFPLPFLFLSDLRKARRRRRVEAGARATRLRFSKRDPFDLTAGDGFSTFGPHHGRAENVVWGTYEGLSVTVFDLPVRGGPGIDFVCGMLELSNGPHPHVRIGPPRPRPLDSDPSLSWQRLGFESELFNQRFEVTSSDRRFGYDLVDARMIHWLMSLESDWRFEVSGGRMLCYRPVLRRFIVLGLDLTVLQAALAPYPSLEEVLGVISGFRRRMPRIVEPAHT